MIEKAKNVYSQNGEDGIIEEIFNILKINSGFVCEFGAWDGVHLSNTFNIYKENKKFIPILIEPDKMLYEKMIVNLEKIEKKYMFNKFVSEIEGSENCLDNILSSINEDDLKTDFQLLSIDIDGVDYEVWKNLKKYKPKIVIIEVNSQFLPHEELYYGSVETPRGAGASAAIMVKLAKQKGYELVCHTGNLIFIVKELYAKLSIKDNSLEKLFIRNWIK